MAYYIYDNLKGVHFVNLSGKTRMVPILESAIRTPLNFSSTIEQATELANLTVCINTQWYGLGIGPSGNQGISVLGTGQRLGNSSPLLASISQQQDYSWIAKGAGDPPSNIYTGVGGLCPLIINGLNYGTKNEYSEKFPDAIYLSNPKDEHIPYLTQRYSAKFAALSLAVNKGKAGFGIKKNGSVIIAVEEDSAAKLTYDEFRSCFLGCIHAFACDGSDSVFLYYKGQWMVKAAIHKNATQTAGVGFREENES